MNFRSVKFLESPVSSAAGPLQGSEISTPYSSVTSLSEDTLQYLETHQHLLPGAKRPASASRSRVASLRHSVRP